MVRCRGIAPTDHVSIDRVYRGAGVEMLTGSVASFFDCVVSKSSGSGSFSRFSSRASWLAIERWSSWVCVSVDQIMASRELSSYWSRWQGESWAGRPCSAPCRQFQSPCSSPAQLSASNTRQALRLALKTYLVTGLVDAALANVGCAAHFDCVFGICRKSKCRS